MYTGGNIRIPLGIGSWDGNENWGRVAVQNLTTAKNVYSDRNVLRKARGSEKYDANAVTGTPTIAAGFDWWPDASTQRTVTAWANGTIYCDKTTPGDLDSTALKASLGASKMVTFCAGGQEDAGNNRKLFIYNGYDPPQVLSGDGTSTTDIGATGPKYALDWSGNNQPVAGVIHEGFHCCFGNSNAPHTLYVSKDTDHEDFRNTGSYVFTIYPGEGQRIAAIVSWLEHRLYIFKYPRGIYYIDTTDLSGPGLVKVTDAIGMAGPAGICRTGDDVLFFSSTGSLHSLAAVMSSADVRDSDLTAKYNLSSYMTENADISRINRARIVYDEGLKLFFAAFTSMGGTVNDRMIVGDISDLSNIRLFLDDKEAHYEALWVRRATAGTEEIFGGGAGGFVYRLGTSARSIDGAGYEGRFKTPPTDFGFADEKLAVVDKRFDWLELVATPLGSHYLSVDVYIDDNFIETLSFLMGTSSTCVFPFVLDGAEAVFPESSGVISRKQQLHGRGQRIYFDGHNSGVNTDFALLEMYVSLKAAGERGTR